MAPWHQAIWGSEENQDGRDLESEHTGCSTAALSGAIHSYLTVGTCLSLSGVGLGSICQHPEKDLKKAVQTVKPRAIKV